MCNTCICDPHHNVVNFNGHTTCLSIYIHHRHNYQESDHKMSRMPPFAIIFEERIPKSMRPTYDIILKHGMGCLLPIDILGHMFKPNLSPDTLSKEETVRMRRDSRKRYARYVKLHAAQIQTIHPFIPDEGTKKIAYALNADMEQYFRYLGTRKNKVAAEIINAADRLLIDGVQCTVHSSGEDVVYVNSDICPIKRRSDSQKIEDVDCTTKKIKYEEMAIGLREKASMTVTRRSHADGSATFDIERNSHFPGEPSGSVALSATEMKYMRLVDWCMLQYDSEDGGEHFAHGIIHGDASTLSRMFEAIKKDLVVLNPYSGSGDASDPFCITMTLEDLTKRRQLYMNTLRLLFKEAATEISIIRNKLTRMFPHVTAPLSGQFPYTLWLAASDLKKEHTEPSCTLRYFAACNAPTMLCTPANMPYLFVQRENTHIPYVFKTISRRDFIIHEDAPKWVGVQEIAIVKLFWCVLHYVPPTLLAQPQQCDTNEDSTPLWHLLVDSLAHTIYLALCTSGMSHTLTLDTATNKIDTYTYKQTIAPICDLMARIIHAAEELIVSHPSSGRRFFAACGVSPVTPLIWKQFMVAYSVGIPKPI